MVTESLSHGQNERLWNDMRRLAGGSVMQRSSSAVARVAAPVVCWLVT